MGLAVFLNSQFCIFDSHYFISILTRRTAHAGLSGAAGLMERSPPITAGCKASHLGMLVFSLSPLLPTSFHTDSLRFHFFSVFVLVPPKQTWASPVLWVSVFDWQVWYLNRSIAMMLH